MLTVHQLQLSEVTELRWDGTSELIQIKVSILKKSMIDGHIARDCDLIVQVREHGEVAELRWDCASELIRVEVPKRATKWESDIDHDLIEKNDEIL